MASRWNLASACCTIVDVRGDVAPEGLGGPSEAIQLLLATMADWAQYYKLEPPAVLSLCRTRQRQQQLQAAWDRGDREGLAARPVDPDRSAHVPDRQGICRAVDLANSRAWLLLIGPLAVKTFSHIEWGGTYLRPDLPHFEERR